MATGGGEKLNQIKDDRLNLNHHLKGQLCIQSGKEIRGSGVKKWTQFLGRECR